VFCPRNAFDRLNERRLSESKEWKFESRLGGTKPETNPNSKMTKIQNLFKPLTIGILGLFRISDFVLRILLVALVDLTAEGREGAGSGLRGR
jgi:hypothetical protein